MANKALIYVLQKEVPGLGLLTKVGMSTRSGSARAREYGGRDWKCVKEYAVTVGKLSTLREVEQRVHEQLKSLKCKEAAAFGLTEVFSCTPEIAMAVIKDVVGTEPTIKEEANRLLDKMEEKAITRLRKQYESEYAKILRDGARLKNRQGWYGTSLSLLFSDANAVPLSILDLCDEYLEALKRAKFEDPIFKAMLESQQESAILRLEARSLKKFWLLELKMSSLQRRRIEEARRRMKNRE